MEQGYSECRGGSDMRRSEYETKKGASAMNDIFEQLNKVGYICERERSSGRSLSREIRTFVTKVLQDADRLGLSRNMINTLIQEGEEGYRREN